MLASGEMRCYLATMVLYIKRGCPWCVEAEAWLSKHGVKHSSVDVLSNRDAFAEMIRISGQSKAPVLVDDKDNVLADFGVEELPDFLQR
jgi:glutaredoxin